MAGAQSYARADRGLSGTQAASGSPEEPPGSSVNVLEEEPEETRKTPSGGVISIRPLRVAAQETAKNILKKIQSTPRMRAVRVEK